MYKQVVVPNAPNYSIPIPQEWYGLPVEIVAFPIHLQAHEEISPAKTKLSEKYRGVFSAEDAKSFNDYSQATRNEWNNISRIRGCR